MNKTSKNCYILPKNEGGKTSIFALNVHQWVQKYYSAVRFCTVHPMFQHSTHISVGLHQVKSAILQYYTINFTLSRSKDDC